MRVLDIGGIPTSLGELINLKYHLDLIKHDYDRITLGYYKQIWKEGLHTDTADWPQRKEAWDSFLDDIGKLFFTGFPYVLIKNPTSWGGDSFNILVEKLHMQPQKINLSHLLCKGTPLELGEEYIVITTKVRQVEKSVFLPRSMDLWGALRKLSNKYKIVVLGERVVEMRREYESCRTQVFGIYDQIVSNVHPDRLVDLTLPALGENVSSLAQVQQDCLIMNQAKFVITVGVGGNACMAHSCAKMSIGFRADRLPYGERLFSKDYPDLIVTKDWRRFISLLGGYL